eukprot:2423473-Prymnesium_polylepis.1
MPLVPERPVEELVDRRGLTFAHEVAHGRLREGDKPKDGDEDGAPRKGVAEQVVLAVHLAEVHPPLVELDKHGADHATREADGHVREKLGGVGRDVVGMQHRVDAKLATLAEMPPR